MKESTKLNLEEFIFGYIDEMRVLFAPSNWSTAFLDYSKNEILATFFIYRKKKVTMGEVAEYIGGPLNTATGVISRLEKKGVAVRNRDANDKRVVNIELTIKGEELFNELLKDVGYYVNKIYQNLTKEEMDVLVSILNKSIKVFKESECKAEEKRAPKKVKKIQIE